MSMGLLVRLSIRPRLAFGSEPRYLQSKTLPILVLLAGLCVAAVLAAPNTAIAQPAESLLLSELETVHVNLVDATGRLAAGERRALERRLVERLREGGLTVQGEESDPTLMFTVEQAALEQGWHRVAILVELVEPAESQDEGPAPRAMAWKARANKVFSARAFGRQQALTRLLDEQAAYVLSQSGYAPAVSSEQGMVH